MPTARYSSPEFVIGGFPTHVIHDAVVDVHSLVWSSVHSSR
jgi:hypothetical protein